MVPLVCTLNYANIIDEDDDNCILKDNSLPVLFWTHMIKTGP